MHTFYVLRKVYQLHKDDPLLYQPEYTQEQLIDIFSGERAKQFKPSNKQHSHGKKERDAQEKKVEAKK